MLCNRFGVPVLAALLGWASAGGAAAGNIRPPDARFERIDVQDGLPDSNVNAIAQDSQGFLWFGTDNGLVLYDGAGFQVFKPVADDASSLSHRRVTALFAGRQGGLWAGTPEGLNRFDPSSRGFERFVHDPDDPASLGGNYITALLEDRSGNLWAGTRRGGLSLLEADSAKFVRFQVGDDDPGSLSANSVWSLLEDRAGNLWLGTSAGLDRLERPPGVFHHIQHDPDDPDSLSSGWVIALHEDSQGILWIGTGAGLDRMDRSGRITHFVHNPQDSSSLSYGRVTNIAEDGQGVLWVGTVGSDSSGGLNRMLPGGAGFESFHPDPDDPYSLSSFSVASLLVDRSDVVWAGTYFGGLSKLDRAGQRFPRFRHGNGKPGRLEGTQTMSVLQDSRGVLWAGTWGGGLHQLDASGSTFTVFRSQPGDPKSLPDDTVLSLLEDRQGDLWLGTFGGLARMDRSNGSFSVFEQPERRRNWILSLHQDRSGRLWGGTFDDLVLFDPAKGEFSHYPLPRPAGQTRGGRLRPIVEDSQGRLWMASGEGDLVQFDPATECYTTQFTSLKGLSNITSIHLDGQQRLWLGSSSDGLHRYDLASGDSQAYGEAEGLYHNRVWGIEEDTRGYLWIATARGLSRFDPRSEEFRSYDVPDGLRSTKMGYSATCRNAQGRLFFVGGNGLLSFVPDEVTDNSHLPPVALTGFRLFAGEAGSDPLAGKHISQAEELRLAHFQNDFSFSFAALDFRRPSKNRLRYRLENYDSDWRVAETGRATYTNLPPGSYAFRVQAANDDGLWNLQGASLNLIVAPPWWRTAWATALFALLAAAGVVGLVQWRVRSLNRRADELRQRVEERTADVLQQKEEVVRQKEALQKQKLIAEQARSTIEEQARRLAQLDQLKSRFFANISHEFRTPLALILGPLQDALEGRHGPLEGQLGRQIASMHRSASRLLELINQLLDLARLESGGMQLEAEPGDLAEFVRTVVLSLSSLAERRSISLQFHSQPESIPACFDRDKMEKILANLLSNAFKFTPQGGKIRVALAASGRGESIEIQVKDTGKGIPAEDLPRIFDRFHQAAGQDAQGTGIGLALARELAELHGGSIQAQSEAGFGSAFTVSLPLAPPQSSSSPAVAGAGEGDRWGDLARRVEVLLPEAPADQPEQSRPEPQSGNVDPKRPLVLVVEDNADVRLYLRGHLEKRYRVEEAPDGQSALQQARRSRPDLVISDVRMPQMDGYDLCRALKGDAALNAVPVILLTAKASQESKVEGLETGADDYIFKPFSSAELMARAENLIELRRILQQRFSRQVVIQPNRVAVTSAEARFVEQVQQAVEARMQDSRFGVDELALEAGLSVRQLGRKLRACLDLSPGGFIRMMRLKRAASLLEQQHGNVSEVAYAVGFQDPNYFSRLFSQTFGVPPSEYREEIRTKTVSRIENETRPPGQSIIG